MDIEKLILNQLPTETIDEIVSKVGVDKGTIKKIISGGSEEIIKNGTKTAGDLFDNLEITTLSKSISEKINVDKDTVSKVLLEIIPFLKKYVNTSELMKIVGGLSDGFGIDDIENIAGAILDNNNNGEKNNSQKSKKNILGNILGGLFGKK